MNQVIGVKYRRTRALTNRVNDSSTEYREQHILTRWCLNYGSFPYIIKP